jgi:ubiquinone/menaquinone biosynthesis C-methylase UbiE
MSFYAKHVLPRLIELAMKNKEMARLRAQWIPQARGEVLEVGIGSGLNLAFYSGEVQHIFGVDPSMELQRLAQERASVLPLNVEFLPQSAEEALPLANSSIDTALLTWTLCSIPNHLKALDEIKRVLKPSGRLIFIEHGRAPDPRVSVWQDCLTPIWKKMAGGCHLNRKIDEIIARSGFDTSELHTCYMPGPKPMTYTYQGIAQPMVK